MMNSSKIWGLFSTPNPPKNLTEFRKNYKKLSIKFHPDKLQNSKTQKLDNSQPNMEIINTLKQWLEVRIKATSTAPDYNLNTQEFTNFLNKLITYESYAQKLPNSTNFWQTATQNLEDFDKILSKISPKLEPKFTNVPFKKTNFNQNSSKNPINFDSMFDQNWENFTQNHQNNQKTQLKTSHFSSKTEKNQYKTTNFNNIFTSNEAKTPHKHSQNTTFYGDSGVNSAKTPHKHSQNTTFYGDSGVNSAKKHQKTSKNYENHTVFNENNTNLNENGSIYNGDFFKNNKKWDEFGNNLTPNDSKNNKKWDEFSIKFDNKFNNPTHTDLLNNHSHTNYHHNTAHNSNTYKINENCSTCDEIWLKIHAAHSGLPTPDEVVINNPKQDLNSCLNCRDYINYLDCLKNQYSLNDLNNQGKHTTDDLSQDQGSFGVNGDYVDGVGDVLHKTVGKLFNKPLKKIKNIFKKK